MDEAHHRGDLALPSVSIADNIFKLLNKKNHPQAQLNIKCDNNYLIQHVKSKNVYVNSMAKMLKLFIFIGCVRAFCSISDKLW
jgi:hypothetical protein